MPSLSVPQRYRSTDALVFSGALAIAIVHALDDAFLHRQHGVGLGQHAAAGLLAVVLGAIALYAFPRVRPGLRAMLALGLGVPALVNGALHVVHIGLDAPARSDLTGVLATVAGLVLIGLAASIPWRHRGAGATTRAARWRNRAIAVPAAAATTLLLVVPVAVAILEIHKPRERLDAPPSAAYETVSFRSTDGLKLSGWYRPSRNGAAVLLVHGGGGDRSGVMDQARLLDRHGYGVLVYDSRGRGQSEGSPNSWGWGWEHDADGAMDFLATRTDIEPGRIGALGLSSGADTVIEISATRDDVAAAVADGAALRTLDDARYLDDGLSFEGAMGWVMFQATEVLTGSEPSTPLAELVPQITSPLLLISAGTKDEKDYNDAYIAIAGERAEHWNLPRAKHTAAVRQFPAQYERRVTGFFDRALLARR